MTRGGRFRISVADIVAAYVYAVVPLLLLTKMTQRKEFLYAAQIAPAALLCLVAVMRMRLFVPRGAGVAMLMFVSFLLANVPRSPSFAASSVYFASKYASVCAGLLLIFFMRAPTELDGVARAVLVITVISGAYSVFQSAIAFPAFEDAWAASMGYVHGFDVFVGEARRATGIAIYSSGNGLLLSAGYFIVLGRLLTTSRRALQHYVWLIVITAGLAFSQTRGIWVGVLAGTMVCIMLHLRLRLSVLIHLVGMVVLVGACFAVLWAVSGTVRDRVLSFRGMLSDPQHPFLYRFLHWARLCQEHGSALIIGYGTGTAGAGGQVVSQRTPIGIVDNMFLNLLLSVGIVGLLCFGLVLWGAMRTTSFPAKAGCTLSDGALAALKGFVVSFAVSCLTADYLESFPGNTLFWIILGILSVHARFVRSSRGTARSAGALVCG